MSRSKKIFLWFMSIALIVASLYFRYIGLTFISFDAINAIFPWFEYVQQYGLWEALRQENPNYTYSYAYLYLIALASETSAFLNRGSYHKLFGFLFDIFSAFIIYKIVFHKYREFALSLLAGALYFALPTIVLNSSYWGQADNIYTAFLLCCVYFILKDRPVWAVIAWGAAFSFKLQAIFLLPFLLFCILIKKIKWWHLFLSALTFLVILAPAVIAGKPFLKIFDPYLWQTTNSISWTSNAPSVYGLFFSRLPPNSPDRIILLAIGLVMLAWTIFSARNYKQGDDDYILGVSLISVTLTAYLMPYMHERYFFPADALSLAFAFYVPKLFVLPIFFQFSSYIVYRNYLYYDFERKMDEIRIFWAAFINLISVVVLLGWQFYYHRKLKAESNVPSRQFLNNEDLK